MVKGSELEDEIKLQWDDELGLTNIKIGVASGLDLNEESLGWPGFQEHNIGGITRGYIVGAVAMKYVQELYKCEEIKIN